MGTIEIRRPRPGEAGVLSALALRSKAHWGYDAAFLERCRAELTYTERDCAATMFVADAGDGPLGLLRLTGAPPVGELDALFVDPTAMGRGIGRLLVEHARTVARAAGFTALELDADPGARPFYEHLGARHLRDVPSGSIPGRTLPRLRLDL